MAQQDHQPMALAGVKVLDLSRILAGPYATQLFADLGADVVKVENPDGGDDTRRWGPPFTTKADGGRGDAAYFSACNRNKRSITVDFASEAGADLLRDLAAKADIIVENFRPGGLQKYGLDYASIAAINPGIIYCSITGFGQTGPYANRPGYDFLIQGMGGLMSITGQPDGSLGAGPVKVGVAVCDLFTGLFTANAALAALAYRNRTGKGQHIDCALLDSQVAMLANQSANWLNAEFCPTRMGNHHPSVVPYTVYKAADGFVIVACGNDKQFIRLTAAL
ncbi:MAG: CaiB/BaiF CoA transferase family protein, partial [Candidatus Puniceispirillaceae bacterium]